jgi:hypothetical protein
MTKHIPTLNDSTDKLNDNYKVEKKLKKRINNIANATINIISKEETNKLESNIIEYKRVFYQSSNNLIH